MRPGPLDSLGGFDLPLGLQIAFVAGYDPNGRDASSIQSLLGLNVDKLIEVLQVLKRCRFGDVVDEQECISSLEVRSSEETSVFFLTRRIGEVQVVRMAIQNASNAIRILCICL